jgi:hypothetical protein
VGRIVKAVSQDFTNHGDVLVSSAYWYNGYVFTNDGGRGVDILKVRDRATKGARKLPFSNPQTQLFQIR